MCSDDPNRVQSVVVFLVHDRLISYYGKLVLVRLIRVFLSHSALLDHSSHSRCGSISSLVFGEDVGDWRKES